MRRISLMLSAISSLCVRLEQAIKACVLFTMTVHLHFSVSPVKGVYKCFSCGAAGNVVKFIMEHEQLTYPEALKWLANKYHIEVHERETDE